MRLDRSYFPGDASSASRIGPANAWPTMITSVARWRSIVASSSSTSKRRLVRETIVPPTAIDLSAENCPVPCMRGQAGISTWPGAAGSTRAVSSSRCAAGGVPKTVLPPAPRALNRSSWRHITPLGIPVVPPE